MTRDRWLTHATDIDYARMSSEERKAHADGCAVCKERAKTRKRNKAARERYDAHRSLGLVRTSYGWE